MKFLSKLEETPESLEFKDNHNLLFHDLSYEDYGTRRFKHIIINDKLRLSVQASCAMYCIPRKTIDVNRYTHMEFALINDTGFIDVREVIKDEELINKLDKYFDGSIYANVPIELIEELYLHLRKT